MAAEFRDLSTDATAETAAERFAKVWDARIEWVKRPTLFRLGRTLFRVRLRGLGWEVSEDKRIPMLALPPRAA